MIIHRIFQRHHIPPDEFYAKEWRHQAFMIASEELIIEAEIKADKKSR